MEIKYKNNSYDLDIDALTDFVDGNGYHHYRYDFGDPEFEVLDAVVKENITEITVLRTQELEDFKVKNSEEVLYVLTKKGETRLMY